MKHSPLLGSHSTSVGSHNSAHLWSSQEDPAGLGNALEPLGFQQKTNNVIYKFVMLFFYRSHYYNGIHYYKTNNVIIMGTLGGKKNVASLSLGSILGIYLWSNSSISNPAPRRSWLVTSWIFKSGKKYVGNRISAVGGLWSNEYQPCSKILNSYESSIND